MSERTRKEVLERLKKSYAKGSRFERTRVLDEATRLLGYHRKAAIRALNEKRGGKPVGGSKAGPRVGVRGRPKKYLASELLEPLRKIWLTAQQPCGRRLAGALADWVPAYEQAYRRLSSGVKEVLLSASSATLDRLLRPLRIEHRRGFGGTRPGSLLRQQIPIAGVVWDQKQAGYLEFDTVALCGGRMDGDFVWMLDGTDYATAWVEVRAQWNRGQHATLEGLKDIERALPFAVRGLDADNGGEFLNYGVMEWCRQHGRPIELTRSRAYHKNDNAHVEQKNWTHVRQWFGYERYDKAELVALLNGLTCGALGQFQNYFLPTLKLVEKKWNEKGRTVRRYGKVETPYARVLASAEVSAEQKRELQAVRAQLNPFALEREIQKQLRRIEAARQRKPRVSFAVAESGAKKALRERQCCVKKTNLKTNQKGRPLR